MIRLALLWHMHQPYYQDLATGEHILPWVRLHAIKDYWGMVALLREFPRLNVTFNLVPSLLVQIQDFADERAHDRLLEVGLAPAATLGTRDRGFLIANGFHAPVDHVIRPHPRYFELFQRRFEPDTFTAADIRDLQVWSKLVWMDPDRRRTDARLLALDERGRDFEETDKQVLRAVELELLRAVIPTYRELAASGRVELSTSPFYHPILPLLCDTDAHLVTHPGSAMPHQLFRRPEDAAAQLARARELHTSLFGTPPLGVWPSEGSVSDEAVGLLAALPAEWIATDEAILARSLGRPIGAADLYCPWDTGGEAGRVRCLFRDRGLSDLIGFTYQSWQPDAAAADFVGRLREAGARYRQETSGADGPTIAVILDGENAWEHYGGGGRPFLRALYGALADAQDIETVTMAAAAKGPARRLERIHPGSWIHADFYIWAGHRDDHRAWGQLAAARAAFDEWADAAPPVERERAWQELLIAEGSDWFWWYGDDHSSDHDEAFDDLFRRHVRNVYTALGRPVPDDLRRTNISTTPAVSPVAVIAHVTAIPPGDGVWTFADRAGFVAVPATLAGAMHRATHVVAAWAVGASDDALLVEVERNGRSARQPEPLSWSLLIDGPSPRRVPLARRGTGAGVEILSAPFSALGAGLPVAVWLLAVDGADHVLEQVPAGGPLQVRSAFAGPTWLVG